MGFSDPTIYQGDPSPEVDKAWTDLYNSKHVALLHNAAAHRDNLAIGVSRISKDQARLLPNKTSAIPGDEDGYIVGLEVFHQLHCLVCDWLHTSIQSQDRLLMMVDLPNDIEFHQEGLLQGVLYR